MQDNRERFAFLGREFLTWLWFHTENHGGFVEAAELGRVRVDFGQRLTLESAGNVREGSTVKADAPSQAEEARTALRVGKKVARARLLLDLGDRHYELGLDAETLTFAGVKLPTLMAGDAAMRVEERLRLLEEIENIVDTLYITFVNLRREEAAWAPVREAIRAWVQEVAA